MTITVHCRVCGKECIPTCDDYRAVGGIGRGSLGTRVNDHRPLSLRRAAGMRGYPLDGEQPHGCS